MGYQQKFTLRCEIGYHVDVLKTHNVEVRTQRCSKCRMRKVCLHVAVLRILVFLKAVCIGLSLFVNMGSSVFDYLPSVKKTIWSRGYCQRL